MKKYITLLFLALCATMSFGAKEKVIFDTDMGNDCDDVMAQVMLFAYAKAGKADLLCIAINKQNDFAPIFTRLICEHYGFDKLPIYMIDGGFEPKDGHYLRQTLEAKKSDGSIRFPLKNKDEKFENSVVGLRKTLVAQPDNSVVYISVGFLTNIAKLLQSKPDDISPLTGKELVAKKVKYISLMGGGFAPTLFWGRKLDKVYPEYNIYRDAESARYLFANTPVEIVLSPFEVGEKMRFPYYSVKNDFYDAANNPASFACDVYVTTIFNASKNTSELDRYIWDLTSVLYVFNPEYFATTVLGDITLLKDATTIFKPNPNGKIRYLILEPSKSKPIISKCIDLCKVAP